MSQKNGYFSYCPDNGFELHDTEEEAKKSAGKLLESWNDNGEWAEEAERVRYGKVLGASTQTNRVDRPDDSELDEDGCDEENNYWGDYDYMCNYELKPL